MTKDEMEHLAAQLYLLTGNAEEAWDRSHNMHFMWEGDPDVTITLDFKEKSICIGMTWTGDWAIEPALQAADITDYDEYEPGFFNHYLSEPEKCITLIQRLVEELNLQGRGVSVV